MDSLVIITFYSIFIASIILRNIGSLQYVIWVNTTLYSSSNFILGYLVRFIYNVILGGKCRILTEALNMKTKLCVGMSQFILPFILLLCLKLYVYINIKQYTTTSFPRAYQGRRPLHLEDVGDKESPKLLFDASNNTQVIRWGCIVNPWVRALAAKVII